MQELSVGLDGMRFRFGWLESEAGIRFGYVRGYVRGSVQGNFCAAQVWTASGFGSVGVSTNPGSVLVMCGSCVALCAGLFLCPARAMSVGLDG